MDEATLVQARAILDASLTDRCKVDRPADTWDEDTQQTTTTYTPVATDTPCRLLGSTSQGRVIVTGETVTPVTPLLRCPVTLTARCCWRLPRCAAAPPPRPRAARC